MRALVRPLCGPYAGPLGPDRWAKPNRRGLMGPARALCGALCGSLVRVLMWSLLRWPGTQLRNPLQQKPYAYLMREPKLTRNSCLPYADLMLDLF